MFLPVFHTDMSADCFNVGHIEYGSEIYGPGKRTVIWFQGCSLGCKGCWNTQYQSNKPASLIPASELLETILDQGNDVTFLGGEPLQQIGNLSWLVDKLNQYGMHIMLYTGYELEEIEADPQKRELCQKVDILIPGRYRDELRDTNLLWRGSQNQPLIYLHDPQQTKDENQVEITIKPDGSVTCLGYPSEELIKYIKSLDHISL